MDRATPRWLAIQLNTFTNWLNWIAREASHAGRLAPGIYYPLQLLKDDGFHITNLETDLCDGLFLIRLVEKLQQRMCAGKVYSESPSELQKLMNVQMVLDALREDGVKLVNIGAKWVFSPTSACLQVVTTLSAVISSSFLASFGALSSGTRLRGTVRSHRRSSFSHGCRYSFCLEPFFVCR